MADALRSMRGAVVVSDFARGDEQKVRKVGIFSDTHAVFDPVLRNVFKDCDLLLHAGDVGHNGKETEVRALYEDIAPTLCVRGNVDAKADPTLFPKMRLVILEECRILMTHIVNGYPDPHKFDEDVLEHASACKADIVLFGHSHKYSVATIKLPSSQECLFLNPGSAGPRRFKLKRSCCILELPDWTNPVLIELGEKAPPRLTVQQATTSLTHKKRKRKS